MRVKKSKYSDKAKKLKELREDIQKKQKIYTKNLRKLIFDLSEVELMSVIEIGRMIGLSRQRVYSLLKNKK